MRVVDQTGRVDRENHVSSGRTTFSNLDVADLAAVFIW